MFGSIGFPELLMIFAVVLIVFGPKKLPEFAKMLGKMVREFKTHVDEARTTIEREIDQADIRRDLNHLERSISSDLADAIYPQPPTEGKPMPPPPAPHPAPAASEPDDHEKKTG